MKLFNTLTKKVEELKPLDPPKVSVYTCGPTVYDYPHVGNWFTFIRYDLLIRTLVASGYEPKWVMNITDVGHLTSDADEGEDKLVREARKEGKTAWDVAQYYSDYFVSSLNKLNFLEPWQMPRATDHIDDQISLINQLQQKGFTYRISDGIYFDTSLFAEYRNFARLDLDEQLAGSRIEYNPEKKNPSDFALWKFSPKDQKRDMEWDSPWGKGFPGWHIECSSMCLKYLGQTLDIHSGGIDHIPVHHTNEIAQSQSITGKPLANIWMHTNHILINDQKISKSLGNGIKLEDIEARNISLEAFRLHVFESHYRSQSKFSWDSLLAAQNRLLRYKNFAIKRYQKFNNTLFLPPPDLLTSMQDDLNTPQALVLLEQYIDNSESRPLSQDSISQTISLIDSLFGSQLTKTEDIADSSKVLIQKREKARLARNWVEADKIREILAKDNIGINDSQFGPVWYYLS